jgi:hypothetical protein
MKTPDACWCGCVRGAAQDRGIASDPEGCSVIHPTNSTFIRSGTGSSIRRAVHLHGIYDRDEVQAVPSWPCARQSTMARTVEIAPSCGSTGT